MDAQMLRTSVALSKYFMWIMSRASSFTSPDNSGGLREVLWDGDDETWAPPTLECVFMGEYMAMCGEGTEGGKQPPD